MLFKDFKGFFSTQISEFCVDKIIFGRNNLELFFMVITNAVSEKISCQFNLKITLYLIYCFTCTYNKISLICFILSINILEIYSKIYKTYFFSFNHLCHLSLSRS